MVVAEVCRSVDLDIRVWDGLLNSLVKRSLICVLIQDIVMADSVEKVDSRASLKHRLPVGVSRFKTMAISL